LLVRRCIENWVLWILIDIGTVGMYLAKHLYAFAALYLLLLLLSALGLREWARAEQEAAA
jgi:nicotinamide mononucleotide transporter